MLLVIDNYDSFTWNLVHYIGELGADPRVIRNDKIGVDDILTKPPEAIVLSPGPCTPNEAGIGLDLVSRANGRIPIFGVCLGHQTIAQAYGAEIVQAPVLMHGKVSDITHSGEGVFKGIKDRFRSTRYHSLTVKPDSLPDQMIVTAKTADDVIMGAMHRRHPVHGVQFHPESIASEHGHQILKNFLDLASAFNRQNGRTAA